MAMTLSPKNERALAKAAIRSAQPALQSQEHMAWCEAWAQEHYGMPYEQIRQMPMDALEPKLTQYLSGICRQPTDLIGARAEVVEI